MLVIFFFFQAEDGIRDIGVTGVQTCALPILDEWGREILTFVEGEVPHDFGSYSPSDAKLANATRLIRRFHDATAGSALAAGAEIVAHNELGPHNTVFVGDEPVARSEERRVGK